MGTGLLRGWGRWSRFESTGYWQPGLEKRTIDVGLSDCNIAFAPFRYSTYVIFAITLLSTSRPSRNLAPAKKSRANDMAMLLIKPVVVCFPFPFIVCNLNTSGTWAPVLGDDNRTVVIALGVSGALRFLWCWSLEFYGIQPGFILGCVCLKCLCWEPLLPY